MRNCPGTLAGLHVLDLAHAGCYGLAWASWELPFCCLLEIAPALLQCCDWARECAHFLKQAAAQWHRQ